jgi:hypothetical protein
MAGSATFTPQQVLDAGRRAEADGRREYAIQFYRHLTDYWGETAEAAAAREGLTRLGVAVAPAMAPPFITVPPTPYANGALPPMPTSGPGASVASSAAQTHAPAARRLPVPHRERYAAGRFVAGFIIGVGLLSMLAGIAFLAVAIAGLFGKPVPLPETFPKFDIMASAAMITGGLVTMFIGQLAQAVFDAANATRALLEISRHHGD